MKKCLRTKRASERACERIIRKRFFVTALLAILLTGCGWSEKEVGQAELKHFQTRPIDAPFKEVYTAAIEAMFDLGYTVTHSDKESGLVVGEKRVDNPSYWFLSDEDKTKENRYNWLQMTLLVKPDGKQASQVRIKTAVNKETKLNKKAINQVWVYIQRQVLMEEEPKKG